MYNDEVKSVENTRISRFEEEMNVQDLVIGDLIDSINSLEKRLTPFLIPRPQQVVGAEATVKAAKISSPAIGLLDIHTRKLREARLKVEELKDNLEL